MSVTEAVLVTSIEGDADMDVIVGSLIWTVSGSSLITIRLSVWPGLLAVSSAEFLTPPASTAFCLITYKAV